jgi:hypothetical protein
MVIEILVAQRHPINALADQRLHRVFDPFFLAIVPKTTRQSISQIPPAEPEA